MNVISVWNMNGENNMIRIKTFKIVYLVLSKSSVSQMQFYCLSYKHKKHVCYFKSELGIMLCINYVYSYESLCMYAWDSSYHKVCDASMLL